MNLTKKQFGNIGEKVARDMLEKNGFRILDTHVCFWGGEIDIIAEKDDCLHFVEVKTRSSETYLPLNQSVSLRQLKILTRAALNYLAMKNIDDKNWQIDLCAIIIQGNIVTKIEYFEDVDL